MNKLTQPKSFNVAVSFVTRVWTKGHGAAAVRTVETSRCIMED